MPEEKMETGPLFWVIAIVVLVWNGMGAASFIMQLVPAGLEGMPDKYRVVVEGRPVWATVAFGFEAAASVLGALGLLLRRSWAYSAFVVAFLALLVRLFHAAPVQVAGGQFTLGEMVLTVVMPIAISMVLVWFSNWLKRIGVLL